eukprot:gnl/MRDRNA2_/MRDRNA2_30760_c0_seq1.p1 gnl/MRDRNA2_/MRDRNA2_30760_c0~~gnl/MRDRNA2_/MRDRNA2_30760_c0_seq1.p1  ORF type:complete len:538 (-),score=118.06 gnl/MRDRNA2_/MRDRNA2_30760_c0_seq1:18-1430(-)
MTAKTVKGMKSQPLKKTASRAPRAMRTEKHTKSAKVRTTGKPAKTAKVARMGKVTKSKPTKKSRAQLAVLKDIQVAFADLDATLFPSKFDGYPHHDIPHIRDCQEDLRANLEQAQKLEEQYKVPVVVATGNNLVLAQKKFDIKRSDKEVGGIDRMRVLKTCAGIYCNGALVKGADGKEISCLALGDYIQAFVPAWLDATKSDAEELSSLKDVSIMGLAKDEILLLVESGDQQKPVWRTEKVAAAEFTSHMRIDPEQDVKPLNPLEFINEKDNVLSFLILFAKGTTKAPDARIHEWENEIVQVKRWLLKQGLMDFGESKASLLERPGALEAERFKVVCKNVHVPGMAPEIDVSPTGVNKGSAVMKFLEDFMKKRNAQVKNGHVAVFGDAENDIELFGKKKSSSGSTLVQHPDLYLPQIHASKEDVHSKKLIPFDPAVKVAMPWANELLISAATHTAKCSAIFSEIMNAKQR